MTGRIWGSIRPAAILILMMGLVGCGSSPASRYYSLSGPVAVPSPDQKEKSNENTLLSVGPVCIPDYLDRPQIVTRNSRNELVVAQFDLWGGTLASETNRLLVDNLNVFLKPRHITAVLWRTQVAANYKIPVTVSAFEAVGDKVVLKAQWGLVARDGRPVDALHELVVEQPVKGNQYEAVAGAMSDALVQLAGKMATMIDSALEKQAK